MRYFSNNTQNNITGSRLHTFSDFLKFKVIKENDGLFSLMEKSIMFFESGSIDSFSRNYKLIGRSELFEVSLINSAAKICSIILNKYGGGREKVKTFRNIFSAMGLGELHFKLKDGIITVILAKKIFASENSYYIQFFVNGFLNDMLKKEVEIISETQTEFKYKI